MDELIKKLAVKQKQLADVDDALAELKDNSEKKKAESEEEEDKIGQTERRFENATKLVAALGDEGVRCTASLEQAKAEKEKVFDDSILVAASLAYIGPFTSTYRKDVIEEWIDECEDINILIINNFSLENVLANPMDVREWQIQGLPSDALSIENAVLVRKRRRWCLMIYPQGQANRWIR